MAELDHVDGFEWDDDNRFKNWIKHEVMTSECEEVFFNLPVLIEDDANHSREEARFFLLGQTNNNRRLFISFTIRQNKIRVISARDMSRKEREAYAKINS